MAFFPRQHYKRRGARQTAVCDWCGQWVDVQDLILCDVEGFRGYYVCSSHPWEKMARVNPSFNDRGGVGQVNDPGHDFLPAPGGGMGFWDVSGENMAAVIKTSDETRTSMTLAADSQLVQTILSGVTYWFRLWLPTTGSGDLMTVAMNGTATATYYVMACETSDGFSTAVTSLGSAATVAGTGPKVEIVEGTIVCNAGGTFGLYWASLTGASVAVNRGAYFALFTIG